MKRPVHPLQAAAVAADAATHTGTAGEASAPDSAVIPRRRAATRGGASDSPLSFQSLRSEGIQRTQRLSGEQWTDYNLHDPGVTMLELLSYGLTDLVYRIDFPVADHLMAAGAEQIDYSGLSLHPPQHAFPCRATHAADLRKVLLDQVAGLDDVRLRPLPSDGSAPSANTPCTLGLYQLQLKLAQGLALGEGGDPRPAQARRSYRAQRNLCEDIDARLSLIDDVLCDLVVDVELSGPREPTEVLADIYARCSAHIAQGLVFSSLAQCLARGMPLEQIYTGPSTEQGHALDEHEGTGEFLFVSDLSAIVTSIDGVQGLRRLALRRDGEGAFSGALRWRGDNWALRLRVPGITADVRSEDSAQALLDANIVLRRRASVVAPSVAELIHRLADLYAASLTRRRQAAHSDAPALPHGQHRDLQRYVTLQNELPGIYGVGRHGLPPSASVQDKAQARQLQSYLLLFEQVMAHSAAQIDHLRELFSGQDARGPTQWWNLLDSRSIPGINDLYLEPRYKVQAQVYEPHDARLQRKSRVIDHLLALHGESYGQNALRQHWDYLTPAELETALLDNKAAYLSDLIALNRDRGAGLDYARANWDQTDAGSGLQRRLSHLLGFRHAHIRPLMQVLKVQKRSLCGSDKAVRLGAVTDPGSTRALRPHLGRLSQDELRADLGAILPLRHAEVCESLLRCGLYPDRYRLLGDPVDDLQHPEPTGMQTLVLGPDDHGHWWTLGHFDSAQRAARAADSTRRWLMHLSQETEGLHVVEHSLLRPLGPSPEHDALAVPDGFWGLRLSVVLPNWTARCRKPNFREFAQETVEINAPAHVLSQCLWLDPGRLARFETAWREWLAARLAACEACSHLLDEAEGPLEQRTRLNQAATAVLQCLLEAETEHAGH